MLTMEFYVCSARSKQNQWAFGCNSSDQIGLFSIDLRLSGHLDSRFQWVRLHPIFFFFWTWKMWVYIKISASPSGRVSVCRQKLLTLRFVVVFVFVFFFFTLWYGKCQTLDDCRTHWALRIQILSVTLIVLQDHTNAKQFSLKILCSYPIK